MDRPNPPPTARLRGKIYFHGAPGRYAEQILRDVALRPRAATGVLEHRPRVWTDPMHGRTYLTPDLYVAAGYATFKARQGLIVTVDGRNLTDVEPDEDAVGMAVAVAGGAPHDAGDSYEGRVGRLAWSGASRTAWGQELWSRALPALTKYQREQMEGEWGDPVVSVQAKVGKKVLPRLSRAQRTRLMELGAAISNYGALPVDRAFLCSTDRDLQWDLYDRAAGMSKGKTLRMFFGEKAIRLLEQGCQEVYDVAGLRRLRRKLTA